MHAGVLDGRTEWLPGIGEGAPEHPASGSPSRITQPLATTTAGDDRSILSFDIWRFELTVESQFPSRAFERLKFPAEKRGDGIHAIPAGCGFGVGVVVGVRVEIIREGLARHVRDELECPDLYAVGT